MKFNISNMTVALAAAALGAASCTANYEDINRNPYEVKIGRASCRERV